MSEYKPKQPIGKMILRKNALSTKEVSALLGEDEYEEIGRLKEG